MISESQLLALLTDIETSQVEHTVSLGNTNKFCQAVCAFSNDFNRSGKPGYQLVGGDDSGRPQSPEVYRPDAERSRGKVWIRIGARRAVATEYKETVLIQRRISAALTFDALPNLEASLSLFA